MEDSPSRVGNVQPDVPISFDEQRLQLQRILASEVLRNAPGLKKFLDYVTSKTIEGLSNEIKEYAIGTDVLGRTGGYDPKVDTVVRVQANRLRDKLEKYYEGEGASDPILLGIPKGHYIPSFSRRIPRAADGSPAADLTSAPSKQAEKVLRVREPGIAPSVEPANLPGTRSGLRLALLLGGTALVFAAVLLVTHLAGDRAPGGSNPLGRSAALAASVDDPTAVVWSDFLTAGSSPMVGYSNSIFLATEDSDLLRVKSEEIDNVGAPAGSDVARRLISNPGLLERAGPVFFEDLYTGTGEVMATFYLTRLFTQAHSPLGVKRGRLVTIDDLSQHDMIFLGSTVENNLLAKLPLTEDFVFVLPPSSPHLWGWRIVNLRPHAGESQAYETERDPKTQVLRTDYALVSFLPGITPARRIAVLGGLTTIGTQAAADFATSQSGSAELLAHLGTGAPPARRLPSFYQAVLKVEIMKGDVLRVGYVAGHAIEAGSPPPRS